MRGHIKSVQHRFALTSKRVVRVAALEHLLQPANARVGTQNGQPTTQQPMRLPGVPARSTLFERCIQLVMIDGLFHSIFGPVRPFTGANDPT